jgi:hypothetical protein
LLDIESAGAVIVAEVLDVYKHTEVIVRQMLHRVQIVEASDVNYFAAIRSDVRNCWTKTMRHSRGQDPPT